MRIQFVVLILIAIHYSLALTTRPQHQLSASTTAHQWFYAGQVFQTFQLIGVIVVIVGVGVCCFYCRGFFSRQDRAETTVVVAGGSRQENRVAAPPPRRYEPDEY
jgi:hypothetical protein